MLLQKSASKNVPRSSFGSILIIIGAAMVLACLLLVQPFYTFAQLTGDDEEWDCRITVSPDSLFKLDNLNPGDSHSRTLTVENVGKLPAYIWLKYEWVDGNPPRGQAGDLFSQLIMTITWRNIVLYSGSPEGLAEPLDVSLKIGPLRPGQTMDLDFFISLPGPETGNVFQGSTVTTRVILITACGTEEEEPPGPPGTDPPDPPDPPEKPPEPPGTDPPDLPRTSGIALTLIIVMGFALILTGLVMKKQTDKEERV